MKKSYLNLMGRSPESIHQELSYLFMGIKRLSKLQKDSFEYAAISYDIKDRVQGFKNFFNQDVDVMVKGLGVSLDEV